MDVDESLIDLFGFFQKLSVRLVGAILLVDFGLDGLQLLPDFVVSKWAGLGQWLGVSLVCLLDLGSITGYLPLLYLDPILKISQFLLQNLVGGLLKLFAHSFLHVLVFCGEICSFFLGFEIEDFLVEWLEGGEGLIELGGEYFKVGLLIWNYLLFLLLPLWFSFLCLWSALSHYL